MSEGRSNWSPEQKTIRRRAMNQTAPAVRRTIEIITHRVVQCRQFYPWPALEASLQTDIDFLTERLNELQSKTLSE